MSYAKVARFPGISFYKNIHYSRLQLHALFQVHFFGRDDKHHLSFEEFSAFVNAIQREVLRAEFLEYSRGLDKVIVASLRH